MKMHRGRLATLLRAACVGLAEQAQHGTVDLGRYRTSYVRWGEGPCLVWVHGLGDTYRTFTMPMYLLHKEYTSIAYNQPTGDGDGARLRHYGHKQLVEDLFRLLDRLHVDQALLAGYSFGSTVVLRALYEQPERFIVGALICGFAHRPLKRWEWWLAWLARTWLGPVERLPYRNAIMRKAHFEPFLEAGPEAWEFFLQCTGSTPIRAMAHWALELHRTDVRPVLPHIRTPVLVLCGEKDVLVPFSCQELFLKRLPHAAFFRIDGCGHFPTFSHPVALARALHEFTCAVNASRCLRDGDADKLPSAVARRGR
ncbi:MAG: hypothetical protein C4297_05295 [Gemmataceae bacterium]